VSFARKNRGCRPTARLRTEQAYPGDRDAQKEGPRRMTGSFLVEPRGARSAFVGWDLGRNDHTDEVGRGRPAEPVLERLRDSRPICTLRHDCPN
jgi:hypothetical protein